MVATPAVPVLATAVAECMWEAVVVPVKPLKVHCTRIVFVTVFIVIVAVPVPGDVFEGLSAGPLRAAV